MDMQLTQHGAASCLQGTAFEKFIGNGQAKNLFFKVPSGWAQRCKLRKVVCQDMSGMLRFTAAMHLSRRMTLKRRQRRRCLEESIILGVRAGGNRGWADSERQ